MARRTGVADLPATLPFGRGIALAYNSSMNFLGVGPAELIVILVVALVFVGPERLPRLAADIARTIREIRKYTGGLAAEFGEVVKEFEKDTEGERSAWKEIGEGISGATQSVTEAIKGARADADTAGSGVASTGSSAAAAPVSRSPGAGAPVEAEWREIGDAAPEPAPGTNGHNANGHGAGASNGSREAGEGSVDGAATAGEVR